MISPYSGFDDSGGRGILFSVLKDHRGNWTRGMMRIVSDDFALCASVDEIWFAQIILFSVLNNSWGVIIHRWRLVGEVSRTVCSHARREG